MATVPQGQSQVVSLGPNDAIKVFTQGEAYVDHLSGTPESPYASARLIKNTEPKVFGPYGVKAQLRVRAIELSALYGGYTDPQPALVNTDPTTNQTVIVGPDGKIYPLVEAEKKIQMESSDEISQTYNLPYSLQFPSIQLKLTGTAGSPIGGLIGIEVSNDGVSFITQEEDPHLRKALSTTTGEADGVIILNSRWTYVRVRLLEVIGDFDLEVTIS